MLSNQTNGTKIMIRLLFFDSNQYQALDFLADDVNFEGKAVYRYPKLKYQMRECAMFHLSILNVTVTS